MAIRTLGSALVLGTLTVLGCSSEINPDVPATGATGAGPVDGEVPLGPDGTPIPTPEMTAGPGPETGPGLEGGNASGTQLRLRLLTSSEYTRSVAALLGDSLPEVDLPADRSVDGFVSIGVANNTLSAGPIEKYEAAARQMAAAVFSDEARYRAHLGCEPAADLSGVCTTDYITRFGRLAFRRALEADEVSKWNAVAQEFLTLSSDPVAALSELTTTMLHSPNFLYRVERGVGDGTSPRFRLDGYSLASRLSFLLTGAGPNDALLSAAEAGSLNTADGVLAAAAPLIASASAQEQMTDFFLEYAGVSRIEAADKSAEFTSFDQPLKEALLEETKLWLANEVLGADADMKDVFDSPTTYLNPLLAAYYGVDFNGEGFQPYTYTPESGRAGIFGQGSFLAAHAGASTSHPTRRGAFIVAEMLCQPVPSPDGLEIPEIPEDDENAPPLSTRQKFEKHATEPACKGCHALMDPYGFALEHFDAIGRYRTEDNGVAVDATTQIGAIPVNGVVELSSVIKADPRGLDCLAERFSAYANANSAEDPHAESLMIAIADEFRDTPLAWRQFLTKFVASEAFQSAPLDARTAEAAEDESSPEAL